jgi:hypothetical protein
VVLGALPQDPSPAGLMPNIIACLPSRCDDFPPLFNLSFLCDNDGTVFKATMSFGLSISDFITAIELANRIRKTFVDAPSQFKNISDE